VSVSGLIFFKLWQHDKSLMHFTLEKANQEKQKWWRSILAD